jgi:hypothetical protein
MFYNVTIIALWYYNLGCLISDTGLFDDYMFDGQKSGS